MDKLGLVPILQQKVKNFEAQPGVTTYFTADGTPTWLSSNLEIVIYRVIQEALTNIRKHADATEVGVKLQFQPDSIFAEIYDNGNGFCPDRVLGSEVSINYLGLLGMKDRVEMLGGTLNIDSKPGAGTTIAFTVPIA